MPRARDEAVRRRVGAMIDTERAAEEPTPEPEGDLASQAKEVLGQMAQALEAIAQPFPNVAGDLRRIAGELRQIADRITTAGSPEAATPTIGVQAPTPTATAGAETGAAPAGLANV